MRLRPADVVTRSGSWAVNGATNQIVGMSYDANGNQTTGWHEYDIENRLVRRNFSDRYGYSPSNERIWRKWEVSENQFQEDVYFYGVDGKRLGVYQLTGQLVKKLESVYFGGKLIGEVDAADAVIWVHTDRLGTVAARRPSANRTRPSSAVGYCSTRACGGAARLESECLLPAAR